MGTLDPHRAGLFFVSDPGWKRKLFWGGVFVALPVVGWPVALGYRKVAVMNALQGVDPVLPAWRGRFLEFLLEGWKAMGVIFTYYLPAYLVFGLSVLQSAEISNFPWVWFVLFFVVFPPFAPLALPGISVYFTVTGTMSPSGIGECASVLLLFGAATFIIPAAFLRVSATGRYAAAFDPREALKLIARQPRLYGGAWLHSILMSLVGHFCIPFSPWGVFWCYLGIVYLFNEIHVLGKTAEIPTGSWFHRAVDVPRGVRVLRLGPVHVPIPRWETP